MQRAVEMAVLSGHCENATLLLEAMVRLAVKSYQPYEDMLLKALPVMVKDLPVVGSGVCVA